MIEKVLLGLCLWKNTKRSESQMGIIRNFDANKAKVQLKLSLNRLTLIQAKKNALNQNMRREIGQLLKAGEAR
jgi:hypothetical protein